MHICITNIPTEYAFTLTDQAVASCQQKRSGLEVISLHKPESVIHRAEV